MENKKMTEQSSEMQSCFDKAAAAFLSRRGFRVVDESEELKSTTPFSLVAFDEEKNALVFVVVFGVSAEGNSTEPECNREECEFGAAQWISVHKEEFPESVAIRFDQIGLIVVSDDRALLRHHINFLRRV